MSDGTDGHHHVTVISSDPQATIDVYSRVLGLRLMKRTINVDGPSTYHLYFGDGTGTPWTVLTCFPFRKASRGRVVSDGSIGYWQDRLDAAGADIDPPVDLLPRTREVLFEIATDGPGFTLDEDADSPRGVAEVAAGARARPFVTRIVAPGRRCRDADGR